MDKDREDKDKSSEDSEIVKQKLYISKRDVLVATVSILISAIVTAFIVVSTNTSSNNAHLNPGILNQENTENAENTENTGNNKIYLQQKNTVGNNEQNVRNLETMYSEPLILWDNNYNKTKNGSFESFLKDMYGAFDKSDNQLFAVGVDISEQTQYESQAPMACFKSIPEYKVPGTDMWLHYTAYFNKKEMRSTVTLMRYSKNDVSRSNQSLFSCKKFSFFVFLPFFHFVKICLSDSFCLCVCVFVGFQ